MEPIIKIENVSLVYDIGKQNETKALIDINAEIFPEEYIIFFGPSGCGKSTLLYLIAAMHTQTEGEIIVNNKNLARMSEKEITDYRQETISMVFQQYNLIPSLNVIDNVAIPQTFRGVTRQERTPKAQALLDRFGIGAFSTRLPTELSGGQQQRVSIARSLVNSTPVILADEPTGNLDSKATRNVIDILQELNIRDKKTIILVTHDPNHLQYAHRVFHMKDGHIVKQTLNNQRAQLIDEVAKEKLMKASSSMSSVISDILSVYPELTESRLKAKAIVNYLISEFDMQQLDKLEKLVEDRILGKISKDDFYAALDDPMEKGGAGLNYQSAKKINSSIESLLQETDLIQTDIKVIETDNEAKPRLIQEIKDQLLATVTATLSQEQRTRLDAFIIKRLEGRLSRAEFFEALDLSESHGGVGLRKEVAEDMTRRFEILLIKFKDYTD